MRDKKIAWEKFNPHYENTIHQEDESDEMSYLDMENQEEGDDRELNLGHFLLSRKVKTPFGTYEINDPFSPYNMFECWIGHTNFKITDRTFFIKKNFTVITHKNSLSILMLDIFLFKE